MTNRIRSIIRGTLLCGIVFAASVSLLPGQAIQAQAVSAPLLFHIGGFQSGDLWSAAAPGAPLKPLTNWHYNYAPVLSPDGKYVAYLSLPKLVTDDLSKNGLRGGGAYPANVWVLTIATGNAVRIADQPANLTQHFDNAIWRPTPAWSPDSKQLAWLETTGYSNGKNHYQLVAYDIATQHNTFTVKDAPGYQAPAQGLVGETVAWSEAGIAYTVQGGNPTTNETIKDIPPVFYLYDTHGKQLAAQPLADQTCGIYGWVMAPKPYAVLCSVIKGQNVFQMLNPADKTIAPVEALESDGVIEGLFLDSLITPDVHWLRRSADPQTPGSANWSLDCGGDVPDPIGISPDGTRIVAINDYGEGGTHFDGTSYSVFDLHDTPTSYTPPLPKNQQIDWVGWGAMTLKTTSNAGGCSHDIMTPTPKPR